MSIATIAIIVFAVVALLQIAVSMQFLDCVKEENEPEYDRILGDNQRGWVLINPLSVGAAYSDPQLHELWGLSDSGKKIGRRLRTMTRATYLVAVGGGFALAYELIAL